MIDVQDLETAILEMAREDWCGLYEIIWRVNTVQPDVPQADKIGAARSVVHSLLERGDLKIGWFNWAGAGPPIAIAPAEIPSLLNEPKSWLPAQPYLVVWSDS